MAGKTFEKKQEELEERCRNMPKIPERFYEWCKRQFSEPGWIFYHRNGRYADMFCTECGEDFTVKIKRGETYEEQFEKVIEPPERNTVGKCPKCGKTIMWKAGMRKDKYERHMEAGIGQKYGTNGYVIRWFTVYKVFGPKDKNQYEYIERARVFYYKNRVTPQKDYYYYDGWSGKQNWFCHNIGGLSNIVIPEMRIHPDTYRNMKGTCMEYCMAKEYAKTIPKPVRWNEYYWNITWYMNRYKRNPVLEMLIKSGCRNLTEYILRVYDTNWRKKKPWEMLGINKNRLKKLIEQDSVQMLDLYQMEKMSGKEMKEDEIEWFHEEGISKRGMNEILRRMSVRKAINYLEKQKQNGSVKDINQILTTYNDYIRMAERMGYDTFDEIVYKPKNIKKEHAKLIMESEKRNVGESAKEVYEEFPEIKKKLEKAKKRYEFSSGKYILKMPESVEDIMIEGRTLHHCVSSSDRYFDRIDTGETYIGFVRRVEEEDIPFYSIEFEPGGNVRQKRTYYNRHDEYYEDVIAFLLEWQQEVKKHMTKKEKQIAEMSRMKRMEGMKEFYKTAPEFAKKMEEDFLAADNEPPQIMLDIEKIAG